MDFEILHLESIQTESGFQIGQCEKSSNLKAALHDNSVREICR